MDNTAPAAVASASSFQTIAVLVLFLAVMAVLPWLLRRWQRRQMAARGDQGVQTQVLSSTALSPSQRIVVVEVGQGAQRTRLVLGVTGQQINCLHVLEAAPGSRPAADPGSFAGAMAQVQHDAALSAPPAGPPAAH